MKAAVERIQPHFLVSAAAIAFPALLMGTAAMLDQSMRRPSLARIVIQSFHMVF